MSSFVVSEAFLVGFKEAVKVGIVWLVFSSYLHLKSKGHLLRPFYSGLFATLLLSAAALAVPQGLIPKELITNVIATSFAFFFLASGVALFQASGTNLLLFVKTNASSGAHPSLSLGETGTRTGSGIVGIGIFFGTVLYFLPDGVGTVLFLKELSIMKEAPLMTHLSALIGMIPAALLFIAARRLARSPRIGSFFDLPQILLFLATVKLLAGGIKGIGEISLIPPVQRGFMKFFHDFIHQVFVMLMVPDHPLLRTTVWNFIGIFFGPNMASFVSLVMLGLLPVMFLTHSLIEPVPESGSTKGAERRKVRYNILSDRRRKALPVSLFIVLTLVLWFSQGGESVSQLYNPKPKPVVEDKGMIVIPINDPTMNLMDGLLHKFSFAHQGEEIRLMVIKKSTNALSVCLDACEICQPDGYGQREAHVICIYCNTPIPIESLGEPGGCNPIPLAFSVDDNFVRISTEDILKKWEYVKTGKSKEGIK